MSLCHEAAPSALSLYQGLREGRLQARDALEATLARIDRLEPQVHAWLHRDAQAARAQADAVDALHAQGAPLGLLAGIPLAVKDIFDTADFPTAYGSPLYQGHRPKADAAPVAQARNAGAIALGKTVTTEFAYFTPGPTANPWNLAHTPGGSSSGSAAAVASGMVPLALGSQTAGSLIRPASYCGVFALKPTYGRFSVEGAKAFSHSLDTLGWLARSADDLELLRCALAGEAFQPLDTLAPATVTLLACQTHEWPACDAGGAQAWARACAQAAAQGMAVREVSVPAALAGLVDAQKTIMAYEAARSLEAEFTQHRDQLSSHIQALVTTGQATTEAAYQAAQALAQAGREQIAALMQGADALLVPAAPGEAPVGLAATGDPIFSRVWNLLGLPCVNVPGLRGPSGLPIGMQLVGHPGGERRLLEVAKALQPALDEGGAAQSAAGG